MRFLLIEDSDGVGEVITRKLELLRVKFPQSSVTVAPTMTAAREHLAASGYPDLAFVDLKLPDSEIEESVAMAIELDHHTPVIIMTGFPEEARRLLGSYPIEVIPKDEHFARGASIFEAIGRALFRRENTDKIAENLTRLHELIGEYPHASPQR